MPLAGAFCVLAEVRIVAMGEPTEQEIQDYMQCLREHWLQWEAEFGDDESP